MGPIRSCRSINCRELYFFTYVNNCTLFTLVNLQVYVNKQTSDNWTKLVWTFHPPAPFSYISVILPCVIFNYWIHAADWAHSFIHSGGCYLHDTFSIEKYIHGRIHRSLDTDLSYFTCLYYGLIDVRLTLKIFIKSK